MTVGLSLHFFFWFVADVDIFLFIFLGWGLFCFVLMWISASLRTFATARVSVVDEV